MCVCNTMPNINTLKSKKEAFDDVNLLDIGKQTSRFYSQRFEQFLLLRDSVERTTQDPMNKLQFSASMYGSKKGREYEVYKHIPQKGTLYLYRCPAQRLFLLL